MRFALACGFATIFVAVGIFACSGNSNTPSGSSSGGTSGSSGSNNGTSGGDQSSGGTSGSSTGTSGGGTSSGGTSGGGTSSGGTSSGGTSSGGTSSGGTSGGPTFDAGTPVDGGSAGSLCLSNSVAETEPNDATPNPVAQKQFTFCGSISPATDVDELTFTAPANMTKIALSQMSTTGALKVEGTADGAAFAFNTPAFKQGGVYVLKMSTTNGAALDYRITVDITAP